MAWDHAERFCQTHGGHLFHIANAADQQFFQNLLHLHAKDHPVWLGLNDKHQETKFVWVSGNRFKIKYQYIKITCVVSLILIGH